MNYGKNVFQHAGECQRGLIRVSDRTKDTKQGELAGGDREPTNGRWGPEGGVGPFFRGREAKA